MRIVKRIALWLLLVLVLIAAIVGGVVGWSYHNTDAAAFDAPAVRVGDTELTVNGYRWNAPVMGGLLYKSSEAPATLEAQDLGVWTRESVDITLPDGCLSHLVVKDAGGGVLLDANNETRLTLDFPANGRYTLEADVTVPREDGRAPARATRGDGTFRYRARIEVNVEPKLAFSAVKVEQGSVITVLLTGFLDGLEPTVETDLSLARFCDVPGGKAAFIGVHYNREPGVYNVRVACGALDVTQEVTVVHRDFPRQDLWIDLSSSSNAVATSPGAGEEWRNVIYPIYETADPEIYWDGVFVRPCAATAKNSEYGLFRYTNGASTPERHAGIDYDCDLGDAVWSPARGKVVFAGFLKMTGNTVVVEHGGGLKSFFFHMDSLACAEGDMVEREQVVGYAGTTGYSTGPHLHYEARIGNQSVDPEQLFSGASGLYLAAKRRA